MTRLIQDDRNNPLPAYRWGRCHQLQVGSEPVCTDPIGDGVKVIGILATVDVRVAVGKAPVASDRDPRLPANMWIERLAFSGEKVSAIACEGEDDGEIEITEMVSW